MDVLQFHRYHFFWGSKCKAGVKRKKFVLFTFYAHYLRYSNCIVYQSIYAPACIGTIFIQRKSLRQATSLVTAKIFPYQKKTAFII